MDCEELKGKGIWEIVERGACRAIFDNKVTGVTATIEQVANATNPAILNMKALGLQENTAAITLPMRVHLKNPLLGNSCYIGSEASPIELHLTTGTTSPNPPNKPISGKRGTPETLEETIGGHELEMLRISENSLVDNAFSVPTAEGCGEFFSFIIAPLIDAKLKLPSEDGNNTAILDGPLNASNAEEVEANEKYQAETETKKQQEEAEAKKKQEEAEAKKRQEELEAKRRHWGHWPHWQPARRSRRR